MKTASLKEIKDELKFTSEEKLNDILIRLVKYRKENKELISYLLFESENEQAYINGVKKQIDIEFNNINTKSFYLAKKTIRKVLRTTNKYIKYSANKTTEVELLIYFIKKLKDTDLSISQSRVLENIYFRQKERIRKVLSKLHEDLQYDFSIEMKDL